MNARCINWPLLAATVFCAAATVVCARILFVEGPTAQGIAVVLMFGLFTVVPAWLVVTEARAGTPVHGHAPHPDAVTFTDTAVRATCDGEESAVRWSDLTSVIIVTTDAGPFAEDLFWGLNAGDELRVAYGKGAAGSRELLAEMQQRLPGFDDRAVIEAMGSTDNARFIAWRRADRETG